ncbi:putative signal transduction protein [Legionella waltersii]|uniref:Putative signal transduction protein n=1 Tax=Legionella waltersii TaxID=66969 RepID=A0A0W1AMG4_9GAMM|nr:putative signal transduction protein [Legionella waltersii]SNU95183.1 putative signal transduction protein [Legionella waltersii]
MLHEYKIPSNLLELEITKATVTDFLGTIEETLIGLHDMGVNLTFDNFGAGYSSLSHLKKSPVHSIKLKQSQVDDIGLRKKDNLITKSTIALAKELGLNVVVGGVETEAQLNFLRSNRCPEVQGYYNSKPLTVEEMTRLIDESS